MFSKLKWEYMKNKQIYFVEYDDKIEKIEGFDKLREFIDKLRIGFTFELYCVQLNSTITKIEVSVVDIHKKKGIRPKFDVYIGRKITRHNKNTEDLKEYWYKDSKWANPYKTAEKYEPYIKRKIAENPKYYNLEELYGKRLGDWCITTNKIEPLICHGQILLKLIKELN